MIEAVITMGGLGLLAGLGLGIASKVFYVYVDPKIEAVEEALAGANCGGCGYPGCSAAAEAIVKGALPVNACVAGGPDVHAKVAEIMGVEVEFREVEFAESKCRNGAIGTQKLFEYTGPYNCRAAAMIAEGDSICEFTCMGYGTCAENCPFDAIRMDERNIPQIIPEACMGCGTCERLCPKGAIALVSDSKKILKWNRDDECASPCQATCPTQIEIPKYIKAIAEGRYQDAVSIIKEHNPLPLVCGRVCPHPCEDVCRRTKVDEAVAINDLKRFAADYEYYTLKRHTPIRVLPDTGHKVAIIGGGPAGLSAAFYLRRLGHSPTIFERMPKLGGALQYGIPAYRLPKDVLDWEIEGILEIGVEARTNQELGRDFTIQSLLDDGFEAIFLAGGAQLPVSPGIEGEDLEGVLYGIDYLRDIGLGSIPKLGNKVVVIGGGNVAIDVALSAIRTGPEEVYMVCLESRREMPAWEHEIQDALVEGVVIINSWGPKRIIGENGRVKAIEFKRCTSVFDETGRFNPTFDEEQSLRLLADNIIITIGQRIDPEFYSKDPILQQLDLTPRNSVLVDPITFQSNIDYIFSAGEMVTGPNVAVLAIAGGRRAALSIHEYLTMEKRGRVQPLEHLRMAPLDLADEEELKRVPRTRREVMPRLRVEDRKGNWNEVNLGYTEEQARREANRCLNCGIYCFRL